MRPIITLAAICLATWLKALIRQNPSKRRNAPSACVVRDMATDTSSHRKLCAEGMARPSRPHSR